MEKEICEKRLPERQGVIFLLYKDGKVLLEDRKHPEKAYFGYVIIPGGKLEKDKDLNFQEAAEREVLEECGVKVKKMIYLDTFIHMTISNKLYESALFVVTEFDGEVTNNERKSDHIWANFEEAEKMLVFADSRFWLQLGRKALIKEGLLKD